MNYKIPRGTYDILPEASFKWQKIIEVFRQVANSYGFEEIITPIFEVAGLFERSSGESSDVVQKEMYRFTDQKGRVFALRPEGTAPVVRSYIENHLGRKAGHNKLYYAGAMFRYDRPQAGRYRQFYQYGIESIGSNHPFYDAEVIALLLDYLARLGLKQARQEINSVGCTNCSKDYDEALKAYYQPHLAQLCLDCQTRYDQNPRRLLDCKVPSCQVFRDKAPVQLDYLDAPCQEHFDALKKYLDFFEITYTINPQIVRGLDYYTNTAFEIIYDDLGAQNSLAGGGRYNALVEQLGGKDTPAVGFAGGFERLLLALEKEGISPGESPQAFIYMVMMGEEAQKAGLPVMRKLREKGLRVDFNPEKGSFKSQMKAADASSAEYCVIIGEDELANKSFAIKDMQSGQQENLSLAGLLSRFS